MDIKNAEDNRITYSAINFLQTEFQWITRMQITLHVPQKREMLMNFSVIPTRTPQGILYYTCSHFSFYAHPT